MGSQGVVGNYQAAVVIQALVSRLVADRDSRETAVKILLRHRKTEGIAMVVVMIAIFVLALLAGGFAYSMKVETKLAMNSNNSGDLECLGRSGVEVARWVLAQEMKVPNTPFDAPNQVWAGGPGETNDPLAGFVMQNIKVGDGTIVKITITDCERKFNINSALNNEDLLQHALIMTGVDAADVTTIIASIEDWIDQDDDIHMNGAETEYYQGLNPPYRAKNGPIDDLSELLFIKGITPDIYSSNSVSTGLEAPKNMTRSGRLPTDQVAPVKLIDLFTPISNGKINLNTASATVLQMLPGADENYVNALIEAREIKPFTSVGEAAANTPNGRGMMNILQRFCTVRSSTFEAVVDVQIAQSTRRYHALLVRNSPTDVQILNFNWR